jgi:hypothetical protein
MAADDDLLARISRCSTSTAGPVAKYEPKSFTYGKGEPSEATKPREPLLRPSNTYALAEVPGYPTGHPLFKVHVCDNAISTDECLLVRRLANRHVDAHGWQTKRHQAFPTTDFAVSDCPALDALLLPVVRERIYPALRRLFPLPGLRSDDLSLRDLFYVKYCAEGVATSVRSLDRPTMQGPARRAPVCQDRLKLHRDGTLLSFTLLVSEPEVEFEGGGTYFHSLSSHNADGTGRVVGGKCGSVVLFSGRMLHAGAPVTRGTRYVVVGFVHVASPVVDWGYLNRYPAGGSLPGTVGVSSDRDILTRCLKSIRPTLIERHGLDATFCPSLERDEDRAEVPEALRHPDFQ